MMAELTPQQRAVVENRGGTLLVSAAAGSGKTKVLVDRVVEMDLEEKRIRAYKNVTINEPFFNGHFPGHPIMPGVLIIEAMAQAAGLLGFSLMGAKAAADTLYLFVGSDNLRFRSPVTPGDQLILGARVLSTKRGLWKFECQASVDGKAVCSGEIICAEQKE